VGAERVGDSGRRCRIDRRGGERGRDSMTTDRTDQPTGLTSGGGLIPQPLRAGAARGRREMSCGSLARVRKR